MSVTDENKQLVSKDLCALSDKEKEKVKILKELFKYALSFELVENMNTDKICLETLKLFKQLSKLSKEKSNKTKEKTDKKSVHFYNYVVVRDSQYGARQTMKYQLMLDQCPENAEIYVDYVGDYLTKKELCTLIKNMSKYDYDEWWEHYGTKDVLS